MAGSSGLSTLRTKAELAAPLWHTLGLLLAAISWGLLGMQSHSLVAGEARHGNVLYYLSVVLSEWELAFYVWLGGLIPGSGPVRDFIGGRWRGVKDVLGDIGIAVVFSIAFTGIAVLMDFLLKPSPMESVEFLNPRGVAEIALWVTMSITAGFCEELAFRGYLKRSSSGVDGERRARSAGIGRPLRRWPLVPGVKMVIVITVLGTLFGILCAVAQELASGHDCACAERCR